MQLKCERKKDETRAVRTINYDRANYLYGKIANYSSKI